MEAFLEKLSRTLNRSIDSLGKTLPGILLALVKLNLVAFFLWYAWELFEEAWGIPLGAWMNWPLSPAWPAAVLVAFSAILFVFFGAWAFIAVIPHERKRKPYIPARGSIVPFIVLIAIPIAIIVLLRRCVSYEFCRPLSHGTADNAEWFIKWLSST